MLNRNKVRDIYNIPRKPRANSFLYTIWELIKNDKAEELFKVIASLSNEEKFEILNGKDSEMKETVSKKDICLSFFVSKEENLQKESRAVFQAVIFGSMNCLRVLMELGGNILQQEQHGWNVLHYLVMVCHATCEAQYQKKAVKIYKELVQLFPLSDIRSLLMMEDKEGLRPLELAAHAGCLYLLRVFFNTRDVYLIKIERRGLVEKSFYDVTEYESVFKGCTNRRSKHPLNFLDYLDERILKCPASLCELRCGALHEWVRRKFSVNFLFILFWFLHRAICFVAFYCIITVDVYTALDVIYGGFGDEYDNNDSQNDTEADDILSNNSTTNITNSTNPTCKPFQSWYILDGTFDSTAVLLLLYLILVGSICVELSIAAISFLISPFTRPWRWHRCFGRKKVPATFPKLYTVGHMFFMLTAFIVIMAPFFQTPEGSWRTRILRLCLLISCYLSVWSLFYFIQLLPAIGSFVNTLQRLQFILLQFTVVYIVMIFPYPHAFLVLLRGNSNCEVKGFESFFSGMYSTFKIMLNMIDFQAAYQNYAQEMYVAHFLFVFLISILLVNFLVALLTHSATEVIESGDVIMTLQRNSVAGCVESTLQILIPCVYKLLKTMFYHCKDKRIFVVVENITSDIYNE